MSSVQIGQKSYEMPPADAMGPDRINYSPLRSRRQTPGVIPICLAKARVR